MSTPVRKPEIVPITSGGLTIIPTVQRSWKVVRDRTLISEAEVDGNNLKVTNAAGQALRLSEDQADALEMLLAAWKRVR